MNKLKKQIIAAMSFVLVIAISAGIILYTLNYVAFAFDYQITTFLCGTGASVDEEELLKANQKGKEVAIQIGEEGFTLLRNQDNALPLTEDEYKVSVFGRGSADVNFWYMGIGSGAGPSAGRVTLYSGLEQAGLELNPTLKTKYNALPRRNQAYSDGNTGLNHTTANELYEPGTAWLTDDGTLSDAVENYPTAIVVLGRGGSEDGDYAKYQTFTDEQGREVPVASARKDLSRKYNEISVQEEELLNLVRQLFDKVIVVINSANPMELGFLEKYNVDAAINVYFPGNYGTIALGNILTGKANPSGKTADTFAYDISTAPAYITAGKHDMCSSSGVNYVDYKEGIYVGYKWYETAYAERFWNSNFAQRKWGYVAYPNTDLGYDKVVQYPFGFGLSYTTFDWSVTEVKLSEGSTENNLAKDAKLTFTVYVENTGTVAGQDVVQLYCTPPYTKGEIEKSAVNLAAFAKTPILQPVANGGKGAFVTLEVSLYDLASYDCFDLNNNNFMGYEIEKGDYAFTLRTDAHNLKSMRNSAPNTYVYTVKDGYKYETDPVTGEIVENRFTTYTAPSGASSNRQIHELAIDPTDKIAYSIEGGSDVTYMSRENFETTFPVIQHRDMSEIGQNSLGDSKVVINSNDVMPEVGVGTATVSQIIQQLTDDDGNVVPNLSKPIRDEQGNFVLDEHGNKTYEPTYYIDEEVLEQVVKHVSLAEMQRMIKAGSGSNEAGSVGLPRRNYKDGPSGISASFVGADGSRATNFPCEVVVAGTWNWFLGYQLGLCVGAECNASGTAGWYGPACNMHRSPLGGRNFEYYSEDSYLSGVMCAYTVRGAKEKGVICWIKHIAANDEEIGRVGKYTWMSEQAFREIYLLPFRMSVQLGGANAMMAAFNRIGSVRAGSSYALMTEVLRDEWGFKGAVITDAFAAGRNDPDECIRAGVDTLLSWSEGTVGSTWNDQSSATAVIAMQNCTRNMIYAYIDCRYAALVADSLTLNNVIGENPEVFEWWKVVLVGVDVAAGAGLAAWCALTVITSLKKMKGLA